MFLSCISKTSFFLQKLVNMAFLSWKCVNTIFLSIAFKDLLDSSIAPHIKPHWLASSLNWCPRSMWQHYAKEVVGRWCLTLRGLIDISIYTDVCVVPCQAWGAKWITDSGSRPKINKARPVLQYRTILYGNIAMPDITISDICVLSQGIQDMYLSQY